MKNAIFYFVAFLFISCSNNNNKVNVISDKTQKLVYADSLVVPITKNDYYYSYCNNYVVLNDTSYLYRSSRLQQSIDIYNWETKKLHKKIRIQSEGVNRIVTFNSYHYPISKDSLLIPTALGGIYLLKDEQVVLRNSFRNYNKSFIFYNPNLCKINPYKNDFIVYASKYDRDFGNPDTFLKESLYNYSLKKDTLVPLGIQFPDFYKEKCWNNYQYNISFAIKGNKLYAMFGAGVSFYEYDLDKATVVKRIAVPQSQFIDWSTPNPLSKCGTYDSEPEWLHQKQNPIHYALVYDKYKDIFYKISLLPTEDEQDALNETREYNVMPISLMALDNELRVIDEIKLPEKTYDPRDFFITEEGLHISMNNELSNGLNEDALRFAIFQLQQ